MSVVAVACPYCSGAAVLVGGAQIYPHRPDLAARRFWLCAPCEAFVGCHNPGSWRVEPGGKRIEHDGSEPLGSLAKYPLRKARSDAHSVFDAFWRGRRWDRSFAYKWLAAELGVKPVDCHIGGFDEARCRAVVLAVLKARRLQREGAT